MAASTIRWVNYSWTDRLAGSATVLPWTKANNVIFGLMPFRSSWQARELTCLQAVKLAIGRACSQGHSLMSFSAIHSYRNQLCMRQRRCRGRSPQAEEVGEELRPHLRHFPPRGIGVETIEEGGVDHDFGGLRTDERKSADCARLLRYFAGGFPRAFLNIVMKAVTDS